MKNTFYSITDQSLNSKDSRTTSDLKNFAHVKTRLSSRSQVVLDPLYRNATGDYSKNYRPLSIHFNNNFRQIVARYCRLFRISRTKHKVIDSRIKIISDSKIVITVSSIRAYDLLKNILEFINIASRGLEVEIDFSTINTNPKTTADSNLASKLKFKLLSKLNLLEEQKQNIDKQLVSISQEIVQTKESLETIKNFDELCESMLRQAKW